jgi:hypothetical protein
MGVLPRVSSGLLKHPLDKQVLVYDTRVDRVHLLDPTTACVLDLLEEGGWTEEGITAEIAIRLDLAPSPALLPLALEELRKAELLEYGSFKKEPFVDLNRRELLRSAAMAGVAALLIPTVATLTATRGYAQGSAAVVGVGGACTFDGQCLSGVCCRKNPTGVCSTTGCPVPDGQPCNQGYQCASGFCNGGTCAAALAPCANCASSPTGACGSLTCTNGACGGAVGKAANGSPCTGSDQGSSSTCANAHANANTTCCSNNCSNVGSVCTFQGQKFTFTGTCQP